MPLALADVLSRAAMAIDAEYLRPEDLPESDRQQLVTRKQELAFALVPAEQDRIRLILATLADMPTAAEQDPVKARFALERDVADLSSLPEWALAAAARAYRRGEVGDGKWRPTAGELARLARSKCEAARAEAYKVAKVLAAEIDNRPKIDADKRAELKGMIDNIARRKQVADEVRAQVAQAFGDQEDPKYLDPKALSGEAKKQALARLAEHQRELVAEWNANPPMFSPELAAHRGIRQKEQAA